MRKKIVVLALVLFLGAVVSVRGDEVSELKQQMAEQSRQLQEMQQKLEKLEAKQNQQDEKIEATASKTVDGKKVDPLVLSLYVDNAVTKALNSKNITALPEWAQNIKINGDFRYRYEMIDEEGSNNRNRNRIRARLGVTGKVADEIEAGLRLATSEPFSSDKGDPVSTNQTLDDAFSKKSIWLDLAYFKWSPKDSGFNVFGGKMENPFYRVGGNQLIFDGDLTPEGIAVQYNKSVSESDELFVNGGGFWLNEVSSGADTGLWGIQGGLKHKFEDKSTLAGGVSYYSCGNVEGSGALVGTGFQGNTNAASQYVNDYDIAEVFGEYGFKLGEIPTAVFANYVRNETATTSQDTGWLVGGKLGKCKDPGTMEFSYDYRDLEADAVLGVLSDSDFVGGGTNGKGHRFGFAYQLAKNLQGALTYFLDDKGNDNHGYDRIQADMVFKF